MRACSVEKLKWADTYLSREQDLEKTHSRRLMESKAHEPVEVSENKNRQCDASDATNRVAQEMTSAGDGTY